jgi:tetratricopeptide (TPR) repeat protein
VLDLSAPRIRILLLAILGAAALFRIVYLLEYRSGSVFYSNLMLDAQVYDDWARRIAAGEWLGGPVFYHAPLYPYLLAVFYKFLGHHYLPIYLFQMAVGVGTIYLTARVGARLGSAWAGLTAGVFLALYPALPFFETKLMSTTLALGLSTAALAALAAAWERGGPTRWSFAGILIGLAALAHPASLILAPVFALAIAMRRRPLLEPAALLLGTALAVAPATLHNLAAGGGFVPISSQGGITFLQGNSPGSRGLYRAVGGFTGSPLTQQAEEKALAEKALGRPLDAGEVSGYWFRKGIEAILESPGRSIELLFLKCLRWISSIEYSTEYSLAIERAETASLWIPILPFGFLAAAAAAGVFLGPGAYPRLAPVHLYLAATIAPPLVFYVSSRYRIAAVPALAILAGVAVERLAARARAAGPAAALPVAAAILAAGLFTLIPYQRDHEFQDANVHYNRGNLYYDLEDYGRAVEEYRLALAVSDFEFYRINLGNAYTRLRRYDEAIEQYRAVTLRKPRFAKAYIQWAKALIEQGRIDEAREVYAKSVALRVTSPEVEAKLARTGAEP